MLYVKDNGKNNRVIIALHGTGGNATQLFEQVRFIDKEATYIGIEGDVLEGDIRRYFRRFKDGTFDRKSLAEATTNLYVLIEQIIAEEQLEDYDKVILGYSNGANIALSLFREFNSKIKAAILLHPALVKSSHVDYLQETLDIFISSGDNDPFITQVELDQMVYELKSSNYKITNFHHEFGHSLTTDELVAAKKFYQGIFKE